MAIFVWEGKTAQGRVVKGDNLDAPNLEAALARLREQRIRPIPNRVREKGKGFEKEISIPGFGDSVKTKDVSLVTRQLATMIDAGLPIVQCLEILGAANRKQIAAQNGRHGQTGCRRRLLPWPTRWQNIPRFSTTCTCNMVEAGEAGGILNTILNRIALFIEKANRLKKKVKGAMIYPCAIVGVAVIVVSVLMIFVIPVFAELYGSMGQALPAPTQICINISNWFVAYWYTLIIGGVGIVMGFSVYYKTPQGRHEYRSSLAPDADYRRSFAQSRRGSFLPEHVTAAQFRRADLGWSRDHRAEPRAIKSLKKRSWRVE